MSALRWPAYTQDEIAECLRLAFASSPLAQPTEANLRCRFEPEPQPQPPEALDEETVTC
jgi:hypothetical protein